jgi:hypothetical protein
MKNLQFSKPATLYLRTTEKNLLPLGQQRVPLFLLNSHHQRIRTEERKPLAFTERDIFNLVRQQHEQRFFVYERQSREDSSLETADLSLVGQIKRPRKRKWVDFTFGEEPLPMQPFDMHPVTDIIIRQAVDSGVKNRRDLALYKTTQEWNSYPKDTIILAAKLEPGEIFSVWDPPKRKKRKSEEQAGEEQEVME